MLCFVITELLPSPVIMLIAHHHLGTTHLPPIILLTAGTYHHQGTAHHHQSAAHRSSDSWRYSFTHLPPSLGKNSAASRILISNKYDVSRAFLIIPIILRVLSHHSPSFPSPFSFPIIVLLHVLLLGLLRAPPTVLLSHLLSHHCPLSCSPPRSTSCPPTILLP